MVRSTISQADSFGVQLEALVVERFARAAEEEVVRRCSGKEDTGGGGEVAHNVATESEETSTGKWRFDSSKRDTRTEL